MKIPTRFVLPTILFSLSVSAHAGFIFTAILSGDQEVPPVGTSASGSAQLNLNDAMTRLEMNIQLVGLDLDGNQTPGNPDDDVTGMHIHAAPAGINGGVVFGLISPNSDMNADLVIDPIAGTIFSAWDSLEGNATTLLDNLDELFAGGLYFNVHTAGFPGGEIRGQILQAPLPATVALLASGLLLLRRKEQRVGP